MRYALWNQSVDFGRGLSVGIAVAEHEGQLYAVVGLKGIMDCRECMHHEKTLRAYPTAQLRTINSDIRERIKQY